MSYTKRQQRIHDFLSHVRVGVLTTVDPNGDPHGTVIYYTLGEDFTPLFLTRTGTRKYDNLARNNHVMLVVFDPQSQTVAQVVGKTSEITDGYDVNAVAAGVFKTGLKTSEGGMPPLVKLDEGSYTAFRIEPDQIRMAVYGKPESGDYDRIFESIESFELH